MKISLHLDSDDNQAANAKDLAAVISVILGSTYALTRVSGQFNTEELSESAALGGATPLPAATASALPSATPAAASALPGSTAQLPASTASAAPVAGAVKLDSSGIPHDPRIHAKPAKGAEPTINAGDGRWKKKKGIDDATFNAVTEELRRIVAGAGQTQLPPAATAAALTAATLPPATGGVALPGIKADNAPPASLPQLPPVSLPKKDIVVTDFDSLAEWIAANHSEKLEGLVNQLLTHYGFVDGTGKPSLPLLAHAIAANPDLTNTCYNWLRLSNV